METKVNTDRLTWEQIVHKYPDQWVFIIQPEDGPYPLLKTGVVWASAMTKRALFDLLIPDAPITGPKRIKYTGIIEKPDHRWRNVLILSEPPKTN